MFKKKTPVAAAKLDSPGTVIGKGVHIEAMRLTGEESVRIEGQFDGHINLHGSLVLGEAGRIVGDVFANYFLVAGGGAGKIRCATPPHLFFPSPGAGGIKGPPAV
ncbi:MAG: polymer-forming cytoskeletal protein, partial [Defluviitaleaceae bacterium]|nr:polymer-forming cytoskeletal protein [Defluviitaleaceae bacterium]